ncbi:thiamine diphosphate-binding protein [Mycena maculata]|uniref:Thiamine diphosphate-binding protein n=1 Tax=Mycena maculata TaxID=230809 RepID=A0AAD7NM75_9AGAR|nr:thiamine diphosphate-binding protein [Mycena maculata]
MSIETLQAEVNRLRLQLETLQAKNASEPIEIGNYLLARLAQLKVTKMFGVPGDFNLSFLDLVEDHPTVDWVGNCNELNSAYAADGYARVKEDSIGVVLTTFGVGELSAINGVAGAFSEIVPVLHVVGVPSTEQQSSKALLHHTLGDGRYDAYIKAAENFTISQGIITDKDTAAAHIDRVLADCMTRARPVYLTLPTNLVYEKISSERLKIPLSRAQPPNDPEVEAFVLDEVEKLVQGAEDSVIFLVDACAIRHDARQEVIELVKKTGFPVYVAPMGKTVVPENYERYGGIYMGSVSHPDVKEKVESAKLILSIGSIKSDFNTGNFTYSIPTARTVEFHSDHTKVQHGVFPAVGMKQILPRLTARLGPAARKLEVPAFRAILPTENSDTITHAWLWPRLSKFFQPKDVVVGETGTSNFGLLEVPFPEGAVFVSQLLWGSIGWAVGSTLGAAFAAREIGMNRTMLFIGDGSLQLTVQELSVMLRHGLRPIVFVLNNAGYTIERCIRGPNRKYNDISNWNWTGLLSVLGDAELAVSQSHTVHTKAELSALLDTPSFGDTSKMQLVEVMMQMHDAPRALMFQTEMGAKSNPYNDAI